MLSQAYKSFVMMGRVSIERVLSNGLMIRRGYTFELCLDEIIIYDNFQNSGKRKRPDKLPSPRVFKNYNPGASLIVAVSIQTNFSNAPFAPVKISCVTSSPSSPATSIPFA